MAQKTIKTSTLIIVISIAVIVITGTSIGIWLGVRNSLKDTDHPDQDWSFKVTGDLVGDDFNITIKELLNMPQHEDEYSIKSAPPHTTEKYTGVTLQYLFDKEIKIATSATKVTFIAWDGYSWTFDISIFENNASHILAHSKEGVYYDSYPNGGDGYLRLVMPASGEDDFNGQYCIKCVVELRFS